MKQIIQILVLILFGHAVFAQTNTSIVKVLSYNIYHGETSGSYNLDKIATIINKLNPDLVGLQEVDKNTNRTNQIDLARELGSKTGMNSVFCKAIDFDGGEYGIAILTKDKFFNHKKVALPFVEGNEPRMLHSVENTTTSGDTILFYNTHLDYKPNSLERIKQAKLINEIALTSKHPVVLTGDLNDVPGSDCINIFEKVWQKSYSKESPTPTFPSNNPNRKIDYVLSYPNNKWTILHHEVICDSIASDHCAYFVILELQN